MLKLDNTTFSDSTSVMKDLIMSLGLFLRNLWKVKGNKENEPGKFAVTPSNYQLFQY